MRSTLALLLLFGAVIGTSPPLPDCTLYKLPEKGSCKITINEKVNDNSNALTTCQKYFSTKSVVGTKDSNGEAHCVVTATKCEELYKLPDKGTCEITINWKVNDHKHALATCLEYFPTTFVKGTKDGNGKAHCVVTAAYTCNHLVGTYPDVFLMYDKCYLFPKDTKGNYVKGKMADYNKAGGLCKEGKLSVFYSHTHAKFVGMKANKLDIEKLWIGINSDGTLIQDPAKKERAKMMHKNLWKLVEGDYWAGDKLIKLKAEKDGKYKYPPVAKYFFMRTRTDYVMNRIQGSFERTTDAMEATFACEFESKFTAEQRWYCEKMSALGIDAVYDEDINESTYEGKKVVKPVEDRKPRCLYVTSGAYTFNGNSEKEAVADMKNIKGCQEKPSNLHSSGMDDGTGDPANYAKLKNKGPLRIAASVISSTTESREPQPKCKGPVTGTTRASLIRKWRHYEHNGKIQLSASALMPWDPKYPLNECSDFPGDSTTMGLKNAKKIDMPPQVRAQAVCSLKFFQECENRNPCDSKLECENTNEFQPNADPTKAGFFTCKCPGVPMKIEPWNTDAFTGEKDANGNIKSCKWKHGADTCAWFTFSQPEKKPTVEPYAYKIEKYGIGGIRWIGDKENDRLIRLVVREGCKITVRSHGEGIPDDYELMHEAEYGTHIVPHPTTGTLGEGFIDLAASQAGCWC